MSATPNQRSSSRETNRRFARLAMNWYSVDPVQVEKILRAVLQGSSEPGPEEADIVDALLKAQLITEAQANSLRLGHAPTQVDSNSLLPTVRNGSPRVNAGEEPTQIGPYRILRRLGEGGMGAVYLAFDPKENRQVAVKVLSVENAPKNNILQRFHLEGRHGAMLVHPNIVRSYAADRDADSGLHYIVLEYVDGLSAHELLDRQGPLGVGDAVHIILDIARALEHAHIHRIIHRDVKPSNILLTSSGVAKLSDMGLAKKQGELSNLTNTSQAIGTPYYMPYEQALNARLADERSDIYALGSTLYHLVTGELPFAGESSLEIVEKKAVGVYPSVREVIPEVPEALDAILTKMLARLPEDRYQTVSELIIDLERSQLANTIPSFVDRDLALLDPVIRQQWTVPVAPTSPDLQLQLSGGKASAKEQETWFLRYLDRQGNLCKSKVTAAEIVDRLRQEKLSPQAEASRSLQGEFKPLGQWPEFQKVLASLRGRKKPEQRQKTPARQARQEDDRPPLWWWLVAAGLGAGLIVLGLLTMYLLLRSE